MSLRSRLTVGLGVLVALISAVFFAIPASVSAAPSYTYINPSTDTGNRCEADSSLAISETDSDTGSSRLWCHVPGTTYDFNRENSQDVLRVDAGSDGEQGTITRAGGQTATVSNIGNAALFVETRDQGVEAGSVQTCEDIGNWGWLMCPALDAVDSVIQWVDGQVEALLEVDRTKYTNSKLRDAWAIIRNIAFVILIPIMLVMVISTALSFDLFNAYTVKKALPRMVVAIMFIALSWNICVTLINMSNVVGSGISGLMTGPFRESFAEGSACRDGDLNLNCLFSSEAIGEGGTGGILRGVVTSATGVGLLLGLVIFLVFFGWTMVLGIVAAFLVLMMRQLFVIGLMLVAPLAILAWIFPGNDKLWKAWWSIFSKLLIMFPLIIAIITTGRIFAWLITVDRGGMLDGAVLQPVAKLAVYALPYALIPFTFKFAGGMFANLAGMVNDKEKGLFDKARQRRAEKWQRAGNNKFFNPNGRFKKLNTPMGWIADPLNSSRIKFGTIGGQALASELTQKSAQHSADLAKWMSGAGFNQEAATAVMQSFRENGGKLTRAGLQSKINDLKKGGTQERSAANTLERTAPFLLNIYKSEDFNRANIGMAAAYVKASQGFMGTDKEMGVEEQADYANYLNSIAPGLGDTFKSQAALMASGAGGFGKIGYSEQVDADGNYVAGGAAARATQITRAGVRDLTSGKASQLKARFLGDEVARHVRVVRKQTDASGNVQEVVLSDTNTETGVVRLVLQQDTSAGEIEIHDGIDKAKIDQGKQQALIDNLVQAAYGYDTPAETASLLRAELARIRNDASISNSLKDHLASSELRARRELDPAAQIDGRQPPPPRDDE